MAEIRSTLDLVMERTKHMTLSEDEKKEQLVGEVRKKLNGLIQKFADGTLTIEHFERDLDNLDIGDFDRRAILTDELLGKIDLEKDNNALFELLETICGTKVKKLVGTLEDYEGSIETATHKRIKDFRKQLRKTHTIAGSAVVPDLETDEEWQQEATDIRTQFVQKLAKEANKLRKGG